MMELTLDDCLAIAGRECATEHELRAAVCVAVGQALHYRYEARGYSDAAETAKRDADRARAEASGPARAEVWQLREAVDALRARAERAEDERDRAVQEREAFSLRLSAAERERDEARAALDLARESAREAREEIAQSLALVDEARDALARPTYEARKVAPTVAQWRGHFAAGGSWLVLRHTWSPLVVVDPDTYPGILGTEGATWLPLGADDLPCAWPVVP